MKLISEEELQTMRKTGNQSQPVSERTQSANDDDEENDENINQISQSQADKGKSFSLEDKTIVTLSLFILINRK